MSKNKISSVSERTFDITKCTNYYRQELNDLLEKLDPSINAKSIKKMDDVCLAINKILKKKRKAKESPKEDVELKELQDICKEYELSTKGSKADLKKRINKHEKELEEELESESEDESPKQVKKSKPSVDLFLSNLKQKNVIPSDKDVLDFLNKEGMTILNNEELETLEKKGKVYLYKNKKSYLNNVRNKGYISLTEFTNKNRLEQQNNILIDDEFTIGKDGMFMFKKTDDEFIKEMVNSRPVDLGGFIIEHKNVISKSLFNSIWNHLKESGMNRRELLTLFSEYLESDKSIYKFIPKTNINFFLNEDNKLEEECQVKFAEKDEIINEKIKGFNQDFINKLKKQDEKKKEETLQYFKDKEELKKQFEKDFGKETGIEKRILRKYEPKKSPPKQVKKYHDSKIKEIVKGPSKIKLSYDEDGVLESSKQFFYNKLNETILYHPNGKEQSVRKFDQDEKLTKLIDYDEDGKLVKEESYKNGVKEGLQKELVGGVLTTTMYFEGNPIDMKSLGEDQTLEATQLERIRNAQIKEREYRLKELEPELTFEEKENSHCIRI